MGSNRPSKFCECCGAELYKRPKDSFAQWDARAYCSISCKNRSVQAQPIHIRFWEHVDRRDEDECWEWKGAHDGRGYGQIAVGAGVAPLKAHRLSWEIHNGRIPDGLVVCHSCDNPSCVNPAHLSPGTQQENMVQASERGRLNPKSRLNLQPGASGFHGAGPLSVKEIQNAGS